MTILYLVRHGETDWNRIGRYQGQADPPLNERGRAQAEATAEVLQHEGISAIYSSDLRRAQETAQALARRLGVPIHLDPRLREINQGAWQGLLVEEIRRRWPEQFRRWQNTPWETNPPGGERLRDVEARVLAALAEIANRHPNERVAIFTHKLPMALMRIRLEGAPANDVWALLPKNAGWERFEVTPEEVRRLAAAAASPDRVP